MQTTRLPTEKGGFFPLRQKVNSLGKNPGAVDSSLRREKLKKACGDFEALFVYQLLKAMRSAIPKDNFPSDLSPSGRSPGKGMGQGVFLSLMDQYLAQKISEGKSLGVAEMLYRKLSQQMKAR